MDCGVVVTRCRLATMLNISRIRVCPSIWRKLFSSISETKPLQRTQLYDYHVSRGGKMVPFAGWAMPAVYDDQSIMESALHTRKALSLFDVSHMMQLNVSGGNAEEFLESLVVSDLRALQQGSGTLSVITNDRGGIVDDCIITRDGPKSFYMVSNAGSADKVTAALQLRKEEFKNGSADITVSHLSDRSLVALQGPLLPSLVEEYGLSKLYFMDSAVMKVFGVEGCRVSRCGYTGEDGVEISVDSSRVVELCERLMDFDSVRLAGLGCRDILRTEAGLCLYGNELSEDISPVEAGLVWCIGKRRRVEGGFTGSSVILNQLPKNVSQKRVGLTSIGPVLRTGCPIVDNGGQTIGSVTSGCPSPILGCNIAMAYVPKGIGKLGSELKVMVRKKVVQASVTKLPFVKCNYYVKK